MTTAIVPFRCPWHGKSRLRRHLPAALCDALTFSMYADVVDALQASGVERTVSLVHGPCGARAAEAVGSRWVVEPDRTTGLNDALTWMLSRVDGPTLVVAADLPALRAATVDDVLADGAEVVISPTQDGGTGLLWLPRRRRVSPAYGDDSARVHARAARRAGLTVSLRPRHHEHEDVDTVDDLMRTAARSAAVGDRTREVVSGLLAERRPGDPRPAIATSCT